MGILAALGLLSRYVWISTFPLVSGDQGWSTLGKLRSYYPWPQLWDSTARLGGMANFLAIFRYPVYAIDGWMAHFGANWALIERVTYYYPFAIALPVGTWLLAREILGKTRWALLAPVLAVTNTYFLLTGLTEIPLVLSASIGCFAMVAFIRAVRRNSLRWTIATSLIMAIAAAVDVRPVYVTGIMMLEYVIIISATARSLKVFYRAILVSLASGILFAFLQAFWLLPTALYNGNIQLPIASQPDFNILKLMHGLAGVVAEWTGSQQAPLVQFPLNPLFLITPILAFGLLVGRRIRAELLWLALIVITFVFLSKTNNPPFGGVYDFLFQHLPGFNLFREGSKFLYPIAIGYSILIPATLVALGKYIGTRRSNKMATGHLRTFQLVALGSMLAIGTSSLITLENGSMLSTSVPVTEPSSFRAFTQITQNDTTPGQVLWITKPVFRTTNGDTHGYNISSVRHPLEPLVAIAPTVAQSNIFQNFCPQLGQSFCYLNRSVFPYLASITNTRYIVSPAGPAIRALPSGFTLSWITSQLTSMFGKPTHLGNSTTGINYWRVPTPYHRAASYRAVGYVHSGPWSLAEVVPALQSLGIPAVYQDTYQQDAFPAQALAPPDSVSIYPYVNDSFNVSKGTKIVIMAASKSATLQVKLGTDLISLSRLNTGSSSFGKWGLYGPLSQVTPTLQLVPHSKQIVLGPSIAWTPLTKSLLSQPPEPALKLSGNPFSERFTIAPGQQRGPWTELKVAYDYGWQMNSAPPTSVGDGLFNLFYSPAGHTKASATFQYSTLQWEMLGLAISFIALLVGLALIWKPRVFKRLESPVSIASIEVGGHFGRYTGIIALAGLTLAFGFSLYSWYGIPSQFPALSLSTNPYALDRAFGFFSIAVIFFSVLGRIWRPWPAKLAVKLQNSLDMRKRGILAAVLGLATASCGISSPTITSAQDSLKTAQYDGATSSKLVGSSLESARLASIVRNAGGCVSNYTLALSIFPTLPSIYTGRASCYGGGSLPLAGIHDLIKAQSLDQYDPNIAYDLAVMYAKAGNVPKELKEYNAVILQPNSTPTLLRLSVDGLLALQDYQAAYADLTAMRDRFPTSSLSFLAASDYAFATNNQAAGLEYLGEATKTNGGSVLATAVASAQSCAIQFKLQQYNAAQVSCLRVVRLTPSNYGAWDNLAAVEANLGNLKDAVAYMSYAVGDFVASVNPSASASGVSGVGLANLLQSEGFYYLEEGDKTNAIASFTKAITEVPPSAPDLVTTLKGDIQGVVTSEPS